MSVKAKQRIKYCVFDPTGNITALVETPVGIERQPEVAADIMRLEPSVEQVGFVCPAEEVPEGADSAFRMAGGEFCGNAAMCTAALSAVRDPDCIAEGEEKELLIKASGVEKPVRVIIRRAGEDSFDAAVEMPAYLSAGLRGFTFEKRNEEFPLVRLEGIDHIIMEEDSCCYGLKDDPGRAEQALREWCAELGSECLGIMFLEDGNADGGRRRMTPVVYVPGAQTLFWENSCASGSAAAAIWLSVKRGKPADVLLDEPAGTLRAESDAASGRTVLHGKAALVKEAAPDI